MTGEDLEYKLHEAQAILRDALAVKPTMQFLPRPYDVPWAEEARIDGLEDLLTSGSERCRALAQFSEMVGTGYYVPSVPLLELVACERAQGHAGPHLARSRKESMRHGQLLLSLRNKSYAWQWDRS